MTWSSGRPWGTPHVPSVGKPTHGSGTDRRCEFHLELGLRPTGNRLHAPVASERVLRPHHPPRSSPSSTQSRRRLVRTASSVGRPGLLPLAPSDRRLPRDRGRRLRGATHPTSQRPRPASRRSPLPVPTDPGGMGPYALTDLISPRRRRPFVHPSTHPASGPGFPTMSDTG